MAKPLAVANQASRTYRYGGISVDAVQNASCVIMPGQRIALTGPSGSGKSTLLHLLGGLDEPTAGRVDWPEFGSREKLRPKHVVDIFQGPSLLEPLSVIENLKFPLLLIGTSNQDAETSARIALEWFGIELLAGKLPEEISGGQAQRVSIARALIVRPELVLADEPTGQLDIATAASALNTILEIVRETGAAIVVSTHDHRISDQLDEHWLMRDGNLDTGQQAALHAVTIASSVIEAHAS